MLVNLTLNEKSAIQSAMFDLPRTTDTADRTAANIDYNIMMGNLEDPEENEGGED